MAEVGRYERVKLLGRGASGEVWLVRDHGRDGQLVALKQLRAQADAEGRIRDAFRREFATMASLSAPGVAEVYDFGFLPAAAPGHAPAPFFTRAYLEGVPLSEATEAADPAHRVSLVLRLLAVLSPLHRAGVTHGDIKPGNVIVDAAGAVHVIDFGLARVLGTGPKRAADGGSPAFMAPELLQGEPPSLAADLYSLGALLWLTMVGQLPFADQQGSPLRRLMAGARPAIPETLEDRAKAALEVALRALSLDSKARFPSVDEMAMALQKATGVQADERGQRAFVAPRPRGHEPLLGEASTLLSAASRSGEGTVLLWHGSMGIGKSSLLRELKWQQQMAGTVVFETSGAAGFAEGMVAGLLAPARALLASSPDLHADSPSSPLPSSPAAVQTPADVAQALRQALANLPEGASVLWLVDDLDAAPPPLGAVLRDLAYGGNGPVVSVVAAARDAVHPTTEALSPAHLREVPSLSSSDVAALGTDALGPVDGSVLEALFGLCQGVPGPLLEALSQLRRLSAPTAADVRALELSGVEAGASTRLQRVERSLWPLLQLLALVRVPVPWSAVEEIVGGAEGWSEALTAAQRLGVLRRTSGGVALAASGLASAIRAQLGASPGSAASQLLQGTGERLSALAQARLWVATEDGAAIRKRLPPLARAVVQGGDPSAAAELLGQALQAGADDSAGHLRGDLLRARQVLGDHEGCASLAAELVEDAAVPAEERVKAATAAARAYTALARFEDAVKVLQGAPEMAASGHRAEIASELARVHLRAGDYDAAAAAADAGLAHAGAEPAVVIELLCSAGITAGYRGDEASAKDRYQQALQLAQDSGSPRDRARVRSYLAIAAFRGSEHEAARDLLLETVADAREAGDVGLMANASMNLGAIQFHLGEAVEAESRYEAARKLALRMGNVATALQARTNLAHVHVYFGLFERARSEVSSLVTDADRVGHRYVAAQVRAIRGDLAARTDDTDGALQGYDDAIARYRELGQKREQVTHQLQAGEALMDRAGPADASAAADRLASARSLLGDSDDRAATLQLQLLTARVRVASGDAEQAVPVLDEVIEGARAAGERELEWLAHMAAHRAHELLGAGFAGRKHLRAAMEQLEALVVRLPRDYRDAFWLDPRRRQVRDAAQALEDSSQHTTFDRGAVAATMEDPRTARLLDVVKRLAMEHDLDRLLERITENAVDLSGAERGFVLLVDDQERLVQRTVRERAGASQAASLAFSQSIAEAVLIDGDPIVTTDATLDGRLSEYASVHQLALKSVACLPIRTPERTEGVLYLENRRSKGRFTDSVVELLHAFSDQAAIALNNARLHAQNADRTRQLEAANEALEAAKQELEEALSARGRQLDEASAELARLHRAPRGQRRHGMIGDSPPMQHVFAMIDRVCDVAVPVVVEGESGTGKELVARAVHYAGVRAEAPFIAVNCGALPESLLESELFGHVKGAFSGADRDRTGVIERASGGTLFLDEVADMPAKMQIDLLRVLQEGTVCKVGGAEESRIDVRFIAATQRPLRELVEAGRFREDLYYRLHVVQLRLPPLRDRPGDVPRLAEHFLAGFDLVPGAPAKRLSREAMGVLVRHPWPGNVRQLEHLLLQAALLTDGEVISAATLADCNATFADLARLAAGGTSGSGGAEVEEGGRPSDDLGWAGAKVASSAGPATGDETPANTVQEHREGEKRRILDALEATAWNRAKAAKSLGMARRTFYRRLREYQIL